MCRSLAASDQYRLEFKSLNIDFSVPPPATSATRSQSHGLSEATSHAPSNRSRPFGSPTSAATTTTEESRGSGDDHEGHEEGSRAFAKHVPGPGFEPWSS